MPFSNSLLSDSKRPHRIPAMIEDVVGTLALMMMASPQPNDLCVQRVGVLMSVKGFQSAGSP